jgi:hypothetical protein
MATYLADYSDCLLLLMNGDRRDYKQRAGHLDERMQLIEKGDNKNPWFRLCKAGLYFHWALVSVRFGENFKAATTFRKSFLLLKENNKLFPNFPQNKIFMGVEEAVVGTIPSDYQWLATIFGMKGNVKNGISKMTSRCIIEDEIGSKRSCTEVERKDGKEQQLEFHVPTKIVV